MMAPPLAGDVIRPAGGGTFDLHQFLSTMSVDPETDGRLLTAAGFRCGVRRFAQSATRGDFVYIYEVRDPAGAQGLLTAFADQERSAPSAKPFAVPQIAGAAGVQSVESGGLTNDVHVDNTVLFRCGPFVAQVGLGYRAATSPVDAIALARAQQAMLAAGCCSDFHYFDERPGDLCARIGTPISEGRWTITPEAFVSSRNDAGTPQSCTRITARNDGPERALMTTLYWRVEREHAGPNAATLQVPIGGTISETGYIAPGRTAIGTACFPAAHAGGEVLLVYNSAPRAVWIAP